MKKLKQMLCLLLAFASLALLFTSCEKEDVFKITVGSENGTKTYSVSYDFYRTVFVYLKGIVTDIVEDEEGNRSLASSAEKNKAIKEVAEKTISEFYSLVALASEYGISITEEDRAAFKADQRDKLQGYVDAIDDESFDYKGTKEEYAQMLYEKSLKIAGTTPEYYEFTHYRALLEKRLKAVIGGDLTDFIDQSYCHYKQIVVVYAKGDAAAEEAARLAIDNAERELAAGADIDEVIEKYGSESQESEYYFDAYGSIVGSTSGDSLNAIAFNAIKALKIGETSNIMTGDADDLLAYFAIYRRLPIDTDWVCGNMSEAKIIYEYPYVGASSYTPHYSRYRLLLEAYSQNTTITPYDVKAYNRINIKNID